MFPITRFPSPNVIFPQDPFEQPFDSAPVRAVFGFDQAELTVSHSEEFLAWLVLSLGDRNAFNRSDQLIPPKGVPFELFFNTADIPLRPSTRSLLSPNPVRTLQIGGRENGVGRYYRKRLRTR